MFCNTRATLQTLEVYNDMNQAFTNITADAMTREAVDLQQESMTQKLIIQEASPRPHQQQSQLEHQHKQKKFDCAINWIRVPKTASTSVWKAFMQPLLDSQSFSSTYLSENSCIVGPGGCADIWNTTATTGNIAYDEEDGVPPHFGVGSNRTTNLGGSRCFANDATAKQFCYEFNVKTKVMNFGPKSKIYWLLKKSLGLPSNISKEDEEDTIFSKELSNSNGSFLPITPLVTGHVGLDTSLFGWLLPNNPMVFSIFRDPLERLLSSFHYGIRFGANRPGQVKMCKYDNIADNTRWQHRVAEARKQATITNDTTTYQSMLHGYLTHCTDAAKNAYTSFLDPLNKNLDVALNHLEQHVIVGLQDNVGESLQRWMNITLNSCHGNTEYTKIQRTLAKSTNSHGEKQSRTSVKVKDSVVLDTPDITKFDEELKQLIHLYIEEDEVIYKRAVELYEEQSHYGLQVL